MELGLQGRVAVVTGAGRGIGLAIVTALVAEGVHVVAGSLHSSAELEAMAAEGSVEVLAVDLTEPSAPGRLVELAGDRVDILVNNVGAAPARTDGFLHMTDAQWQSSLELNLLVAVRATRGAAAPDAGGRSRSDREHRVGQRQAARSNGDRLFRREGGPGELSKALSKEVGGRGVRVNTVSPGPVATALWLGDAGVAKTVGRAAGLTPEEVADRAAHQSVTGRFTQPSEVADLVVLLASDGTANITGADFTIDGGLITTI